MSTYEKIGDGKRESAISEGFFVETLYVLQRDATIQKERQVRYTLYSPSNMSFSPLFHYINYPNAQRCVEERENIPTYVHILNDRTSQIFHSILCYDLPRLPQQSCEQGTLCSEIGGR